MARIGRLLSFPGSNLRVRTGPSGIHVFHRLTGLNVLLDEVRVPSNWWSRAPRQVSIALTNTCDLCCPHCFAPKTPASLDFDQVSHWVDELDVNGCLGIGFGGGEPTLYHRLVELCRFSVQHTGLAVTLTTHGHGLDDSLVQALVGNVHFVRVSMDGVGTTYEALRGLPFAKFLESLERIRSIAPFGINYIVNSLTLPDLDAATKLAADLGAVELLLLPEQPVHGRGGIDGFTAQALQRWVDRYRGNVRLAVSEEGAAGLPICNPLIAEGQLRAFAHIDASGVLKRSSFDDDGATIGADGIMSALEALRRKDDKS